MLNVKAVMVGLRVKWINRLSNDMGHTWSHFAWQQLLSTIPPALLQGLCYIPESVLNHLDKFYAVAL